MAATVLTRMPHLVRMLADTDAIPAYARVHAQLIAPKPAVEIPKVEIIPFPAVTPYITQPSQKAYDLIALSEGFEPVAYLCPAKVPTIGYGHTFGVTHADVKAGKTITKKQAMALLVADVKWAAAEVAKLKLTNQNQFDALVSFVFNIGGAAFQRSTLRKYLVAGRPDLAVRQFARWNKVKGKVLRGLTLRRTREAALFAS